MLLPNCRIYTIMIFYNLRGTCNYVKRIKQMGLLARALDPKRLNGNKRKTK